MEFDPENRKKLTKWLIGIIAACILIFLGVQNVNVIAKAVSWAVGLIMPLLLGFAFALILNVPMRFFENHLWPKAVHPAALKLRRPTAYGISLIMILGILAGIIWLVIPELVEAVKLIAQSVIDFIGRLSAMDAQELAGRPFGKFLLGIDWEGMLKAAENWLKEQGGNIMNTVVDTIGSVVGGVVDLFVAIVFSIYILFSKERLKALAARLIRVWLPERFGEWLIHAATVASANFRSFVSGQTLEAVILGTLCIIGMLLIGIPYAPMVGTLVGVTALIPVVGGLIGAVVGAFMILTVSPIKAVIFLVFLIVLQQLEGNLIYPRVMGSRVNLPAMWILAAVTVGGGVAGPVGMLLAVPTAATLYTLFREATQRREQRLFPPQEPEKQ
ncbi:MAG: AI-2E family transporter [Ruminococcaceae bacterium]|nr:AI-2E family transporter [Oscillospiraceae bacterium]